MGSRRGDSVGKLDKQLQTGRAVSHTSRNGIVAKPAVSYNVRVSQLSPLGCSQRHPSTNLVAEWLSVSHGPITSDSGNGIFNAKSLTATAVTIGAKSSQKLATTGLETQWPARFNCGEPCFSSTKTQSSCSNLQVTSCTGCYPTSARTLTTPSFVMFTDLTPA